MYDAIPLLKNNEIVEELASRARPALSGLRGFSIRKMSLDCFSISLEKLNECVNNGGEIEEQHVPQQVH